MLPRKRTKSQAIIEYAVFTAVFIAALVAMLIYLKRGFQGYFKQNTDRLSSGEQFSSALSSYTQVSRTSSKSRETVSAQGETRNELLKPAITVNEHSMDDFSDKKLKEEELFPE